jgi:short-subunit dehydrogenase
MNPRIDDWSGKRVWLLGASSGIGAALGRALLARDACVALSARNAARLLEVAAGEQQALVLPCDAADEASLRTAWEALLAAWGGVDVALYVAGDYLPMRAWELDVAKARHMIAVNFGGAVSFAACVVPQLLRQGNGQIGFVASVAGYRGLPKSLIYGPTKAALINFAEALYLDLEPKGIGVRLINPGFRRDAAHRPKRFRHAGAAHPRTGGSGNHRRFCRWRFRNPLSEALHTGAQTACPSAVPDLLSLLRHLAGE